MLKRREECDIYLTHIRRHHWEPGEKIKYKIDLLTNTVAFIICRWPLNLQMMKATILAESSILYFIFSTGSHHFSVVYRCEFALFPSFYHFLSFHLSMFSFYNNSWLIKGSVRSDYLFMGSFKYASNLSRQLFNL